MYHDREVGSSVVAAMCNDATKNPVHKKAMLKRALRDGHLPAMEISRIRGKSSICVCGELVHKLQGTPVGEIAHCQHIWFGCPWRTGASR